MSAARWATFWAAQRGRRDDDHVGAGQQPGQTHLHVAGARRHVDEQIVELAPVDVAQELLDRLGQHQPAPHQRRLLVDEEASRHDLEHPVTDGERVGDDQRAVAALDPLRLHPLGDAEQPRDREAPDVGVEHADRAPLASEGDGQVDRDRALAHAALAAGDGQDPGRCRHLGVAAVPASVPAGAGSMTSLRSSGVISPHSMRTSVTPGCTPTRCSISRLMSARRGHPPMVSLTVTRTTPSPSTATAGTMPSDTMSAPSSGSMTDSRTARTSSGLGGGAVTGAPSNRCE